MGAQLSNTSQQGQAVQQTDYDSLNQASVENVNNSQKGQAVAVVMGGALGAAANAKFNICGASNYAACIAGGVLLGMAVQSRNSANSFRGPIRSSWNNMCQTSAAGCSGAIPNPYEPAIAGSSADLDALKKQAAKHGIQVDPQTGLIQTKNGTIDPNDPASLEAALGSEGASSLMGKVAEMEKNAVEKVNKHAPKDMAGVYGVGGGGTPEFEAPAEEGQYGAGGAGLNLAAGNFRKPAQVSGLSKNFNGEPIGVASDSIFGMMTRRYSLKNAQKAFYGPEFNNQ